MKPFILGVTGVIGSGKSTVCRFLNEKFGFHFIEADQITRELYQFGQPGYKKIKDYFGDQFVGAKEVHRGRLRLLVTKSPQKIWILSQLMHPLIFQEMNKKIVQLKALNKGKNKLFICIEGIYFEDRDIGKFLDTILVIESKEETVLQRLKKRDVPSDQLRTLYKFQKRNVPLKGVVIRNDGSLKELHEKVADTVSPMLQ